MPIFHLPAAFYDPEEDMRKYSYIRPFLTLLILVGTIVMIPYLSKHHPEPFFVEEAIPFNLEMCTPAHSSAMHEGNP